MVLPVLTGPEHEIGHARAEDRLLALGVIQRVDQRKRLVVLVAERTDRPAFEFVDRGLRGRKAGRHARLASRHRQIDRQVMTAELQHPRRRHRRRSQEGEEVLVLGEPGTASAARGRPAACPALAPSPEHSVGAHDLPDLPIPVSTQRRDSRVSTAARCGAVRSASAYAVALKHRRRKVGPFRLLRPLEGELDLGPARLVERGQECLRSGDDARRRIRRGAGRWRRRPTALSETCRSDGKEQAEP